jgi:hypothetical protein
MFFLGLQFGGNKHPWDSSVVIGLLVGAAATFAVFLVWEYYQGDEAMVPFAMLRNRVIWSAAMTLFFVLSSMLMADYYLAIYFQVVHDDSPLMSGVHMLPTTLGLVLFTVVAGGMGKCFPTSPFHAYCPPRVPGRLFRLVKARLQKLTATVWCCTVDVLGYYLPMILLGGALSTVGYGLLSLLSPTTSVAAWIGYQVLYGVGAGSAAAGVSLNTISLNGNQARLGFVRL